MKSIVIGVLAMTALLVGAATLTKDPAAGAVDRGMKWLVAVQGKDGGWGQDGGETSYVRVGENLESKGNDVANTAVAAQALFRTGNTPAKGEYRDSMRRAVEFILRNVEDSPAEGLAVTRLNGTQIQRKLGPFIDTFMTSMLLSDLDGNMGNATANARVRRGLEKCVAKIEKNQQKDGSWNLAGGWAPVLGTSMASRSLYSAKQKGVAVTDGAMARVEDYTIVSAAPGVTSGAVSADAGVPLYKRAQELEQLSRTDHDRKKNAKAINGVAQQLSSPQFVNGFGSMGGEEFFSYLNVSDSLHRVGGDPWNKWNSEIKTKLIKLQNVDGTWAGHHCITGRVAVTSAAILTLLAEREPVAARK